MNLVIAHKGLSFEDCSVWHYTQKLKGTLITGDGMLRKKVSNAGLDVKGIIFILEEIKNQNKLAVNVCIEKLKTLKVINDRLPMYEIDKRIEDWTFDQ